MNVVVLFTEEHDDVLAFAGKELTSYLGLLPVFGNQSEKEESYLVSLEIDAELGQEDSDAGLCPKDAYSYEFTRESGVIVGNKSRSVLLGVYSYLRDLGFVFFRPGKGGTYVPSHIIHKEPLCRKGQHRADFYHRGVCIEGADSLRNVLDFIDWMPKNGYNTFFLQFKKPDVFFERWYNHMFNPLLPGKKKSRAQLDEMERRVSEAISRRGILEHRVGHGWTAEAIGFSGTGWYRMDEEVGEERKALLAQVGGKRGLWRGVPANTNLCYANPEAKKRLVQLVVSYAKEHKSADYIHFWLADEPNNVCECSECVQTTLADQYVEILNEIDRRLTEEKLNVVIVFLLYQELLYAPLKARIEHPRRFCLMFAPISRTFEETYPRKVMPTKIKPYQRNRFELPSSLEENLTHYFYWKEIFGGDCFFYDYPLGRAHYGDFGYMKIARLIYEDVHSLKALGANGYLSCQELRATLPTGFPNYVMGQALLNEGISYEEMKEAYFSAAYGKGGRAVAQYLERLSQWSDMDYFNGQGPRLQPKKEKQFLNIEETAEKFLAGLDTIRDKDCRYKAGWEQIEFHAGYSILLARSLASLCTGDKTGADLRFREFCQYIREKERKFQPLLDVYRIIEVATKYTGFSLR